MLLLLLAIYAHASSQTLETRVEPTNPQPNNAFRLVFRAKKISCDKLGDLSAEVSVNLLKIDDSKVENKEGCERVYVLSSVNTGRFTVKNIKLQTNAGLLTHPDIEIPVGDVASLPKPAILELVSPQERVRQWLDQSKALLATYLSTEKLPGKFSVENCRIPSEKFVSLLMRNTASFTHIYTYKDGCDINGQITMQLGAPVPLDLWVRNVDPIQQVKGTLTITVTPTLNLELKVQAKISNGTLVEYNNKELAKFEYTHNRLLQLNVRTLMPKDMENSGHLKILESEGKPIDFEEKFDLRNLLETKKSE
jgi:hypothetical protein